MVRKVGLDKSISCTLRGMPTRCIRISISFPSHSVGIRHLPVNVVPTPRFAHKAAALMQALRPPTIAATRHKLHHTGVASLLGVAHFQSEPLERRQLQLAPRR